MSDADIAAVAFGKMRILIGADTFSPDVNGSATFARSLAAGLAARGHDVHVMAPAKRGQVGTFTEEHVGQDLTVHRVYSWRWLPHPWLRFMLPWRVKANAERIVRAIKPDVIHFQSHIIVGRGLATVGRQARHPPRRHEPHDAREHAPARARSCRRSCTAG